MAFYTNPGHQRSHHSSFDHLSYYDAYDNVNRPIIDADSMSRAQTDSDKINIFIIFVFILELLVLVFVSVLEYFLRATTVFPVRQLNFSCIDPDLLYSKDEGERSFGEFAYYANVPYNIILPLCFCVPPVIILTCELALWGFSEESQKMIRALCPQCKLPQVIRRMIRYIGSFIFGLLITMIFVDVAKLFIGRLRPSFLETCMPDMTKCVMGATNTDDMCTQKDDMDLRHARLSFPSLHAAVTAFACTFTAVYLHCIIRASSIRLMRPFLAFGFMLLSVMCCLARYGLYYSYWTDVAVGFVIGVIFALYLCISVLHHFRERVTSHRLYQHIRDFMFEQRALELRDLYKENWERLPYVNYPGTGVYAGGIILPRPHVHGESTTDDVDFSPGELERVYHPYTTHSLPPSHTRKQTKPPSPHSPTNPHDTFQRDLQRSVDHYRHSDFGHL